jgi:hypothetical protein
MLALAAQGAHAASPVLAEVKLEPTTRVERNAGVWVDGQYMGYIKELKGKSKLVLVPGSHEVLVKLAGYEDLSATIVVEPGEQHRFAVSMQPLAGAQYPDEAQTARLRISVQPQRAAVFVDGVFAGHVDRFDGRRGVQLRAGTHRFRITLPGYQPFETEMSLSANQRYEIKTELRRGSIRDQSDELIVGRTPAEQ